MTQKFLIPRSVREAFPPADDFALRLDAWVMRGVWGMLRLMGPERASRVASAVMRRIGPRHSKALKVRRNLRVAFPECSPEQIDQLTRDIFGNLGSLLAEYAHYDLICREVEQRVDFVVEGKVRAIEARDQPAIFVTGHFGAWDLSLLTALHFGLELTVIYNPDSNPHLDRLMRAHRAALPCRMIERDQSLRSLMRELSAGHSIGLPVDNRFDGGEMIPFFGEPCETNTIPARLALRFGCELVPVRVERLPGARFRTTIFEPVRPSDPEAPPRDQAIQMTRALSERFEDWIRQDPGQWACTHRRWPKAVERRSELPAAAGA